MEPAGTGAGTGAGAAAPLERDENSLEGTSLGELARGLCGGGGLAHCETPWPPFLLSALLLLLLPLLVGLARHRRRIHGCAWWLPDCLATRAAVCRYGALAAVEPTRGEVRGPPQPQPQPQS